jgi:hypothetical protein
MLDHETMVWAINHYADKADKRSKLRQLWDRFVEFVTGRSDLSSLGPNTTLAQIGRLALYGKGTLQTPATPLGKMAMHLQGELPDKTDPRWEVDEVGTWRFTLRDTNATVNLQNGKSLGEVLTHSALFKLYPGLADVKVLVEDASFGAGIRNGAILVKIPKNSSEDLKKIALLNAVNYYIETAGEMPGEYANLDTYAAVKEAGDKAVAPFIELSGEGAENMRKVANLQYDYEIKLINEKLGGDIILLQQAKQKRDQRLASIKQNTLRSEDQTSKTPTLH